MCDKTTTAAPTLHPFEAAGLGLAPFRFVGYSHSVGPITTQIAPGIEVQVGAPGQPMGTCAYCSRGIAHLYHIKSSDEKRFIVGCDCVAKIGRADNALLTAVQRQEAKVRAEARRARAEARHEARRLAAEKTLQEQRARNGGLTDYEVRRNREEAERQAKQVAISEANAWLWSRLPAGGPFLTDMAALLRVQPLAHFTRRQLQILCDVYSKTFGRSGSQANAAAAEDFCTRVWPEGADAQ